MLPQILRTAALGRGFALGLALALVLHAPAQSQPKRPPVDSVTYRVAPDSVPAGKAFALTLLGNFNCSQRFSHQTVTVENGRIHLGYEVEQIYYLSGDSAVGMPIRACDDPVVNVIPPYGYGPVFQVGALKAGTYEVWSTRNYACQRTNPRCLIASSEVPSGTLTVYPDGSVSMAYHIEPTSVKAGVDFDLQLLAKGAFNCGTSFDHLSVAVNGNQIVLSFMDHANIAAICPAIYKDYGPTFKMKALSAGSYEVLASRLPACVDQGCKIKQILEPAGKLLVLGTVMPENKWFLKEDHVMAGKPFTLQLLNNFYGNCNTTFTNATLRVENHSLITSFSIENHPERVCVTDLHPWGPIFNVPALPAGIYPVYITFPNICPVGGPCPLVMLMPVLVDTLVSGQALGIAPFLTSTAGFQASLRDARLEVTLPPGLSGSWQVEVMTFAGERLASRRMDAEGGAATSLDLGAKPQPGVYLVRIESPDHVIRALPVSVAR